MKRQTALLALCMVLAGCAGNPQRLPVGVSLCNAVETPGGFTVDATVENRSDRPIANLGLTTSFYRNFRYATYDVTTHLNQELDPGQKRAVRFFVAAQPGGNPSGQALRCAVTHIGYLDGTTQDVPRTQ